MGRKSKRIARWTSGQYETPADRSQAAPVIDPDVASIASTQPPPFTLSSSENLTMFTRGHSHHGTGCMK